MILSFYKPNKSYFFENLIKSYLPSYQHISHNYFNFAICKRYTQIFSTIYYILIVNVSHFPQNSRYYTSDISCYFDTKAKNYHTSTFEIGATRYLNHRSFLFDNKREIFFLKKKAYLGIEPSHFYYASRILHITVYNLTIILRSINIKIMFNN